MSVCRGWISSAPRRLQAWLLPQWNRLALRPPMALERSFGGPRLVCPIARQVWRSPVVHETQALGAAGTLWSNALLARRGTEKCSARMASTCWSVSTVGVPTVLLRRSLPAELLPYFAPETRLSPRNAKRLLSIEGETPNYSGCHSARDASKIPRCYVTPGVGHFRPFMMKL